MHPFRAWRIANERTLEGVSTEVDCSAGHLCDIELRNKIPSMQLAAELCRITGGKVKIEDFAP
jgi:hypothetical protein